MKKFYEMIVIYKNNTNDVENENELKKLIVKNSGVIWELENWGEKQLAYPIKNYSSGLYYLLRFSVENINNIDDVERELNILDNILKHIIVNLDTYDITNKEPIKIELKNTTNENIKNNDIVKVVNYKMEDYSCYKYILIDKCIFNREDGIFKYDNKEYRMTNIIGIYEYRKVKCENDGDVFYIQNDVENYIQERDGFDVDENGNIDLENRLDCLKIGDCYFKTYDCAYELDYAKCEYCNEWFRDYLFIDEHHFCSDSCASGFGYVQCADCGDWFDYENTGIHTIDDIYICEDCCDENWAQCEICREYYRIDDLLLCEDDGCCYCHDCYNDSTARDKVGNYHYYKNWKKYGAGDCYFGFELEVENKENILSNNDIISKIREILDKNNILDFLVYEHDGSLDTGFEIISQPFNFEFLLEKKDVIKDILKLLSDNGFASHDTSTCGLHVHFTRDYINRDELSRFIWLFENFKNKIVEFSRRKSMDEVNHWASFLDFEDKSLDYIKSSNENRSRYKCVNLTNKNTIEVRIFKGTLNFDSFMSVIEFVKTFVEYSKNIVDLDCNEKMNFKNIFENTLFVKDYMQIRGVI